MNAFSTILNRNKAPVPVATPEWPELDGHLAIRRLPPRMHGLLRPARRKSPRPAFSSWPSRPPIARSIARTWLKGPSPAGPLPPAIGGPWSTIRAAGRHRTPGRSRGRSQRVVRRRRERSKKNTRQPPSPAATPHRPKRRSLARRFWRRWDEELPLWEASYELDPPAPSGSIKRPGTRPARPGSADDLRQRLRRHRDRRPPICRTKATNRCWPKPRRSKMAGHIRAGDQGRQCWRYQTSAGQHVRCVGREPAKAGLKDLQASGGGASGGGGGAPKPPPSGTGWPDSTSCQACRNERTASAANGAGRYRRRAVEIRHAGHRGPRPPRRFSSPSRKVAQARELRGKPEAGSRGRHVSRPGMNARMAGVSSGSRRRHRQGQLQGR